MDRTGPLEHVTVQKQHDGVLSEVHSVHSDRGDWIVKRYRLDLREAARTDADPRFEVIARWLTLPPYFSSSRSRIDSLQARCSIALPQVLLEDRHADGTWFTVMERLEGSPCPWTDWEPERRRTWSATAGELLRELHEAGAPEASRSWSSIDEWHEEWEQTWHCLVDALPPAATRGRDRRNVLHERVHRLLARSRTLDVGAPVLLHNDFAPSNLLTSEDGEPTGLVDFQLCCPGPAALDLRWLHELDSDAFLDGYGWPEAQRAGARWMGGFAAVFWEAWILVVLHRFAEFPVPPDLVDVIARRFHAGFQLLERQLRAS